MTTHNLNDTVEVVLTDTGAEIYNKYYENSKWRDVNVSEGHILRSQLWSIMQVFGEYLYLGGHVPFKDCLIKFV